MGTKITFTEFKKVGSVTWGKYEKGWISRIFTTNLIYRSPELLERKWFCEVDLSKYISLIIDALNHDMSISSLLNHAQRIKPFLEQHGYDIKVTE